MTTYCAECRYCEADLSVSSEVYDCRNLVIDLECGEYGTHVNFFDKDKKCFTEAMVPLFSTIRNER